MEWSDLVLIVAASLVPYIKPDDVWKLFAAWSDAGWGAVAAVAVVIVAVPLIIGWRKND
jgi:hypothetical protein